jgi:rhodanese-related sulfurtransferase
MTEFEEKEPFQRIDVEQAKTLIGKGFHLIDVREPIEWEQGRISSSTHIPLNTLLARAPELLTEDNRSIQPRGWNERLGQGRQSTREIAFGFTLSPRPSLLD